MSFFKLSNYKKTTRFLPVKTCRFDILGRYISRLFTRLIPQRTAKI